jgi:predicted nucleotidyltransferase
VKYVVIGGTASILHGVPRTTFDLDILIEASRDNAQRLLDALAEAKFGTATMISAEKLLTQEVVIFQDRVRVDVQTKTPGLEFEKVWKKKKEVEYQGQKFFILSLEDLIASKKASGRKIDMEDVEALELKRKKKYG